MTSGVTSHARPGVYSVYEASAVVAGGARRGKAAVAARSQAAVPVGEDGDYGAAFALLEEQEGVKVVVCDSETLSVQQKLRDSVAAAAQVRRERIAVAPCGAGETVSQITARAKALNSERVVLIAPGASLVAAAVAGAICGQGDPALPLGGAALRGVPDLETAYSESDIDALVQAGVTPVEQVGGVCSVIRGVTTRTTTGGAEDSTWRELTTILVVDDVIPGLREALRARFPRAKNTAQTRGAVRSQVILELERKVAAEIITGYGEVTARALEEDPTVCLVEFSFTVAHGLNQIWLSAQITV